VLRRIVGTLAICVVAIVELFYVYGMHILWTQCEAVWSLVRQRRPHDALVESTRAGSASNCSPQPAPVETAKVCRL